MLDVMNVQEIENPESFNGSTKERIIKASGKTAEDLTRMIYVWKQTLVVHTWLQEKWVNVVHSFDYNDDTDTDWLALNQYSHQ